VDAIKLYENTSDKTWERNEMTYYRLALQDRQTAQWIWKTTALTSLQAVFQLLRRYSALPQDSIRVFTASSKEALNELLQRENDIPASSGSVTAAQFLHERKLVQSSSEKQADEQPVQQVAAVSTSSLTYTFFTRAYTPANKISPLNKRRLEIEYGPGGDHDTPYHFTLPASTPAIVAWICLQTKVRVGELAS
jgi:hypothetical protein